MRTGRLTPGQQRALIELWPCWGIDASIQTVDLLALFGRAAPTLLEIGFGNGDAMAQVADQHRDWNCIGAEVHTPGVGHLLLKIEQLALDNVRVYSDDAVPLIKTKLARASLDRVHIWFPDPWHKKRHNKRRLIQQPFLDLLANAMKPGAILHLATDWQEYAEWMLAEIDQNTFFKNANTGYAPDQDLRPQTKFERRGDRLGHTSHDIIVQRI